jgi:hypothetical protein
VTPEEIYGDGPWAAGAPRRIPGPSRSAFSRCRKSGARGGHQPAGPGGTGAGQGADLAVPRVRQHDNPPRVRRLADARFGRYQQALEQRNGIDQLQIGRCPSRKNSADIRMTVDAMETLINHPSVDAFVLVSVQLVQ